MLAVHAKKIRKGLQPFFYNLKRIVISYTKFFALSGKMVLQFFSQWRRPKIGARGAVL